MNSPSSRSTILNIETSICVFEYLLTIVSHCVYYYLVSDTLLANLSR